MFCACSCCLGFGWKGQVSNLLKEWEEVRLVRSLTLVWTQRFGRCSKEPPSLPLMCFPVQQKVSLFLKDKDITHSGLLGDIFVYLCMDVCVHICLPACVYLVEMLPFLYSAAWHPLWYDLQQLYPKSWFLLLCCLSEGPVSWDILLYRNLISLLYFVKGSHCLWWWKNLQMQAMQAQKSRSFRKY